MKEDQFDDQFIRNRLTTAILLVIAIFILGVVGYSLIEGWDILDALYMTVITLATIGYGEVHTLSNAGRLFTIFLILSGLGIMGYGLGITATFIVEGGLARMVGRRRMEQAIAKLHDHYIVCGAGETGTCVIEEFFKTKTPFIVIDSDPVKLEKLRKHNVCYVQGDATKDASLVSAGIHKAKGLVSTLHNDRDNLFVVLTARSLNANLRIVSRVIDKECEYKLRVAGADSVVSPNFIGGMRMASIMIRPAVVSFLDVMLRDENKTMRVEEVVLPAGARVVGQTLQASGIARQIDLIIIAIKQEEVSKYVYNPKPETVLEANDILIVMGDIEQVLNLRKLVSEGVPAF